MYAFGAYSYIVLSVQRTLHILILHLRPIIPLSLRLILVLCCLCRGTLPILILHSRPTLPLPSRPILVLCCLCTEGHLPILILYSRPTLPLPSRPILVFCCLCGGGGRLRPILVWLCLWVWDTHGPSACSAPGTSTWSRSGRAGCSWSSVCSFY